MVECELSEYKEQYLSTLGFNRYMVECECNSNIQFSFFVYVLIDTWWNVNDVNSLTSFEPCAVLIDTWWNVNLGIGKWIQ